MKFKYGSYTHATDEAGLVINKTALVDDQGVPYGYKETWTIDGFLQAASQSALLAAMRGLENAYATHGRNAALLLDDGTRVHVLDSGSAVNGVIVTQPPSYPNYKGGEAGVYRSYQLKLEAEYSVGAEGGPGLIVTWQETIEFTGGGPEYVWIKLRTGAPQRQLVSEQTPYAVSQQGSAVGYFDYPTIPPPIWPAAHDIPMARYSKGSAQQGERHWPVTWSYQFTSGSSLNGRPHGRPR